MGSAAQRARWPALAICVLVLAAAGCGSDEEPTRIPQDVAASLRQQLDTIQSQLAADATCDQIEQSSFAQAERDLARIPAGEVRDALDESFDRLLTLVQEECEQPPPQTETETVPTETETAPPPTTETETEQTETQPPPDDKKKDKQDGGGNGNGNGNGNGGGGGQGGGAMAPGGTP